MKQQEVIALLQEAGHLDCTSQRRNEIRGLLTSAMKNVPNSVGDYVAMGDYLFQQTADNRPDILPSLFPVFALICGDREYESHMMCEIDWLAME